MKTFLSYRLAVGTLVMLIPVALLADTMPGRRPGHNAPPASGYRPNPAYNNSYGGSNSDYPAAEVQAIPGAQTRLALARAEFNRAQGSLYGVIARLQQEFEASPDMAAALDAQSAAYAAYDAVRQRAIQPLNGDPDYRVLLDLRKDLGRKIQTAYQADKPDEQQIHSLALVKMDYAARARELEADRLSGDLTVLDARAKLQTAAARVAEMRVEFRRALFTRPEVVAAQKAVEEARMAQIGAETYYAAALDARDIALDYAYWLRRYERYHYVVQPYPADYYYYRY